MDQVRRLRHKRKRAAYRLILAAAGAMSLWAFGDFVICGIQTSSCAQENYDPYTASFLPQTAIDSSECRVVLARSELHQRRDAAMALLGFSVITASVVLLSRTRRRTKKRLLALEFCVVVVVVAYTFMMTVATR